MSAGWLSILRCPYCRSRFDFSPVPTPSLGAAEFGILRCHCSAFPVVDGVPIVQRSPVGVFEHVTGQPHVSGVPVADIVALLERGRAAEALIECLVVPAFPAAARRVLPWRVANSRIGRRVSHRLGVRRVRRMLRRRVSWSVLQVCEFFFGRNGPWPEDMGRYFVLRFAQPRHLAALAMLANIRFSDRPVLDIACGIGHFEHYFAGRVEPVSSIGTDMNFFQIWIARHWMAPAARYVCVNAEDGLPFQDDAFSATLCSDAYHYIRRRPDLLQEIERCAPGCPVYLTRVGNLDVMPHEGQERTLAGYLEEFRARDVRSYSEETLLRCYLQRKNPFGQRRAETAELERSKWFSFAWNVPAVPADCPWDDTDWPHAVGRIEINPIYRIIQSVNDRLHLRFDFPTKWYAYENHEMLSYHPREVTVTQTQLNERQRWRDDPSLAALIRSFVLVGLPDRFYD